MTLTKISTLSVLVLGLWACEEKGPAEQLGEEVDEAVEDVRNGGETLGNRIDDAADDFNRSVEDARDELRDENDKDR
jgi:hypothetical protein